MLTLLALFATADASELCGEDVVGSVEKAIEEVFVQYQTIDEAAFDRAAKQLDAAVSCLDVIPPGATVARLHQVMALVAFMNGQKGAARRGLIAARLADPTWKLSEDDFPEGHPYKQMWATSTDPGPVQEIGDISPKSWIVDGIERPEAPVERSFLLQVNTPDGIVSSEYLYDFEDIPALGQEVTTDAWETPYLVTATLHGDMRFLSAVQNADGAGLRTRDAAGLGAGGSLGLRVNPISFVGAEFVVGSVGGADPLLGRTFGMEAHAVGLFGASTQLAAGSPYGAARVGYARDTVVGWTNGFEGPAQSLFPVDALVGGVEGGFRSDDLDARLVVDGLFAGPGGLYELRVSGLGSIGIAGPLAVDVGLNARTASIRLLSSEEQQVGSRRDIELRAFAGPTVWFE